LKILRKQNIDSGQQLTFPATALQTNQTVVVMSSCK